jgi:predicted ATPase/class 3 adenylate cyclase
LPAGRAASGPAEAGGERRIVTVLFCDVVDSTLLASPLDPEEWATIMDGAFDFMISPVERYGGTVARLMGDGILAFFGAPLAHEDDPLRSILAALDIMAEIQPFRQRLLRDHNLDLNLRIGINTGTAVVGQIGSGASSEYTAMGDAVNLAARMEQTALPGTIRIAQPTYRLVESLVRVESLGLVDVKGKTDPVPAYQILGIKEEHFRRPGVEAHRSPLIGRDREFRQFQEILQRLAQGHGHILLLNGEAGLGKSRLVQEMRLLAGAPGLALSAQPAGDPPLAWLEAESLSYETAQPYGLIRRQLRGIFGIGQGDPPDVMRRKVASLAGRLLPEHVDQMEEVLAALFNLETGPGQRRLQGETLKMELFDCVSGLIRAWASATPSVLFFEDLHWADLASAELLAHMLSLIDELPLLFICAFRPDRSSAAWMVRRAAEDLVPHRLTEINLRPLSAGESSALAGNLLHISRLPASIGDLILERAQGIPYFVEEIVQDLIERGQVIRIPGEEGWQLAADPDSLQVPDNLEALLVARMDRLEEAARRTLQVAAVIGRTFYYRVLKLVAEGIDQLDRQMRLLQQVGMIQEQARLPELEYMFRHVLAQEAAYNTILLKSRRLFHQRTGEVMEQLFAGQLEEQAPLLAHHFQAAGDLKRSLHYLTVAAQSAVRLYANREAVTHYSGAIEAARLLSADAAAMAELHRGRSLAYETLGDFERARADLEAALEIGRQAGSAEMEWRALLELGKLWAARDYGRAGSYFRDALALARQLEDPPALARSLNRLGNWHANAERPRESIRYHQEALEIAQRTGDERIIAATYDLLGMASMLGGDALAGVTNFQQAVGFFRRQGNRRGLAGSLVALVVSSSSFPFASVRTIMAEEAIAFGQEALALTREIGWRAGESYALWANAALYASLGRYTEAMESAQASMALANSIQHLQWMACSNAVIGYIYSALLAPEKAQHHLEQTLALAREISSQYWINQATSHLATTYLYQGQLDRAVEVLAPIISADDPAETTSQRNCWLSRAELALAQDDPQLALTIVDGLIATTARLDSEHPTPALWWTRGRALIALGNVAEAESQLLQVTEPGSGSDVNLRWRIHATLGQLYQDTARPEAARAHFQAAGGIIETIAATVPDELLREDFRSHAYQLAPLPEAGDH